MKMNMMELCMFTRNKIYFAKFEVVLDVVEWLCRVGEGVLDIRHSCCC